MKPRDHVDPPTFTPSDVGRLLSVVQARFFDTDPHWRNGVVYEPQCGGADTTYDPCAAVTDDGQPAPEPPPKEPTAAKLLRAATPFTVHAEIDCSAVGFWEEAQARAPEALARAEAWEVERAFWTGLAADQTVVFPHLAADTELVDEHDLLLQQPATIVGGPGAVDIAEGLGLLEQALAECYQGVGVIHVPESLVPVLADAKQIVKDGQRYKTWNGNLVAAGAGYPGTGPDGSAPPAGATWMYATGAIFAYRSAPDITRAPTTAPGDSFDRETNTVKMHAERTYVLGWDCCLLAVLVEQRGEGASGVEANDITAEQPLEWDPATTTMSMEPGSDGQVLMTEDGTPQWESPGQPGGLPGPLDANGELPLDQMPIDGLNFQGAWDASTNTPTLADGTGTAGDMYRVSVAGTQDLGSGPLTFEVGDHVIFEGNVWQQFTPPPALAWGDITGTLANQTDLQAALDAKADASALADVATSGAYSDLSGRPVIRDSGTVALHLAGEELLWPTDITTGKIRLYNSTPGSINTFYGFGILNQTFVYQVDGSGSTHKFQSVDDSDNAVELFDISTNSGVVSHLDLHMSEKKIVNVGDPANPRDATNKQYVDAAVAPAPADQTADATLQAADATIQLCDATTAAITLTVAATTPGKTFTIKKTDASANTVTVAPPVPIDGQASIVLSNQHEWITIVRGNNNNWHIIGRGGN